MVSAVDSGKSVFILISGVLRQLMNVAGQDNGSLGVSVACGDRFDGVRVKDLDRKPDRQTRVTNVARAVTRDYQKIF
jgi:hypothetical protein